MDEWYVVQTKQRKEQAVEKQLHSIGLETFLPLIVDRVRAGLHLQRRIVPMFPSYLFVRADLAHCGLQLRYTPGMRDFVRSNGGAQPVPPEIVEQIRSRMGATGIYEPPLRRFAAGERLRIEDGPLTGIEVIFERELSGAERVAVLLAAVSLNARVVLPGIFLSRVSSVACA